MEYIVAEHYTPSAASMPKGAFNIGRQRNREKGLGPTIAGDRIEIRMWVKKSPGAILHYGVHASPGWALAGQGTVQTGCWFGS